jgi:hypothetical protein
VALNRFDWEAASAETPAWQRRRSALRFDRVRSFKSRNVAPDDGDKVLNLLALDFAETDPPGASSRCRFRATWRCGSRSNASSPRWSISGRLGHELLSRSRKERRRKSIEAPKPCGKSTAWDQDFQAPCRRR